MLWSYDFFSERCFGYRISETPDFLSIKFWCYCCTSINLLQYQFVTSHPTFGDSSLKVRKFYWFHLNDWDPPDSLSVIVDCPLWPPGLLNESAMGQHGQRNVENAKAKPKFAPIEFSIFFNVGSRKCQWKKLIGTLEYRNQQDNCANQNNLSDVYPWDRKNFVSFQNTST